MKTLSYLKVSLLILVLGCVTSCVQDDEYTIPNGIGEDLTDGLTLNTTIAAAKASWSGSGTTEFESSEELYMSGYVVSSDAGGNFYKELYIQDDPTNPTSAVRLALDQTDLYTTFEFGRLVYVKLNELHIGLGDGDVLTIGAKDGDEITELNSNVINEHVVRSNTVATVTGLPLNFADITTNHIGMFVTIDNTQVNGAKDGSLPFFNESVDEYDTKHVMQQCTDGSTFLLETSAFANFSQLSVPGLNGSISGIISQDFSGDSLILALNEAADINYENTRCDIDCGLATSVGTNVLFSDNFDSYGSGSTITGSWTNFSESGSETWEAYSGSQAIGTRSARIGAYQSGDASTINWLITPSIDFDAQEGEVLTFQTSNSFSDGSTLVVLFSNDWDGTTANINSATWQTVSKATVVPDSQWYTDWVDSGNVDLSCATGIGYIAFKYIGSGDSNFDGTYELEGVSISH